MDEWVRLQPVQLFPAAAVDTSRVAKFSFGVGDRLKENVTVARADTHDVALLRLRGEKIQFRVVQCRCMFSPKGSHTHTQTHTEKGKREGDW